MIRLLVRTTLLIAAAAILIPAAPAARQARRLEPRVRPLGATRRAAHAALARRTVARLRHYAQQLSERAAPPVERRRPDHGAAVRRAGLLGRLSLARLSDRLLGGGRGKAAQGPQASAHYLMGTPAASWITDGERFLDRERDLPERKRPPTSRQTTQP